MIKVCDNHWYPLSLFTLFRIPRTYCICPMCSLNLRDLSLTLVEDTIYTILKAYNFLAKLNQPHSAIAILQS